MLFMGLVLNFGPKHNKALKTDSQRVAFLVQVEFCVYGAMG